MMRTHRKLFVIAVVCLSLSAAAGADVFNMPAGLTSLEFVTVGDPGNTGELSGAGVGGWGPDAIVGGVDYAYNIGKFEVTSGQYVEFLNAVAASDTYGLYNSSMCTNSYGCKIERSGSAGIYTYSVAAVRAWLAGLVLAE